jgi:hypothetical protein
VVVGTATPVRPAQPQRLLDALDDVEQAVRALAFEVPLERRERWRGLRDRVAEEVAGHRARLLDLDAPLLVVVGGVTGAGKSTFVNSLVGERVSETGPIRPTTTAPTLLAAPQDADRLAQGLGALRLASTQRLPPGVALVDAPDVDSVRAANRELAGRLFDAADVWLFFTESRKYADADSMAQLARASARNAALAVVLGQVRPGDVTEITGHFSAMLRAAGLKHVPLFVIESCQLRDGLLPEQAIRELRAWLRRQSDPEQRVANVLQTLYGALGALPADLGSLAGAVEAERRAVLGLSAAAAHAYREARSRLAAELESGVALNQEVLERWRRFVGTGKLLALVSSTGGRLRAQIRDWLTPPEGLADSAVEGQVRVEVTSAVSDLMVQVADAAAAETVVRWSGTDVGRALLPDPPTELERSAAELRARAAEELRAWQDTVAELVRTKGLERRTKARWLSLGLNAAATGTLLAVLVSTGGLTGAETGVATAASAANQVLLETLLGKQNIAWLTERSREDLLARAERLFDQERGRFTALLDAVRPDPVAAERLRSAAAALSDAVRASGQP